MPGPAKGKGGRPRKSLKQQAKDARGYAQATIGPKGKSRRVGVHRIVAGFTKKLGKGSRKVVDHKDKNPKNNAKKNLRILGRGKNAHR